ncbi:lysophospholipid acyltransferase family protein [Schaalia suimastitidis]|uniref:lysophospholipid acyltransferase family protein n=1 Tax=Schaalia suimastitidis TaxID=121163 RepID=UPI0004047099|nr:lysophospholipid acyltransferase family protein [Schaalia suimastitidis]
MSTRSIGVTGFYRFARTVLTIVLSPWIRVKASGAEHIPTDGGFIAVCNHVSYVDGVLSCWQMARMGVPVRIMAKIELFSVPVVGAIFRALRLVPVDRKSKVPGAALAPTAEALRSGEAVAIYPEGTLTSDPDFWPMKLKTGAARLALDTQVPVIPYVQWGGQKIFPDGVKFPDIRPGRKVTAVVGTPVDLSDLYSEAGSADHEAVEEATRRIHAALVAEVAAIRGETPPDGTWDPQLQQRV